MSKKMCFTWIMTIFYNMDKGKVKGCNWNLLQSLAPQYKQIDTQHILLEIDVNIKNKHETPEQADRLMVKPERAGK